MLRAEGLRYLVESSGEEALFDLERDPRGYADVAADPSYAGRLQEARLTLLQRLLARERPAPWQWPY